MKTRKIFLLFVLFVLFHQNILAPDHDHVFLAKMYEIVKEQNELRRFLEAVAYSESRGNPEAYNKYGYIGKYQFGYITRKSCGYGYIRFSDFVRNPSIWSEQQQDSAMLTLLSKNEKHLKQVIHDYNGKYVKGLTITKSGILAAAHLAGAGGVKKYFSYGYNPKDAYGTELEDYLIRFSGFNF